MTIYSLDILLFLFGTSLLFHDQLVNSRQLPLPQSPSPYLLKVCQVLNILFCSVFVSHCLCKIRNLFCEQTLCLTCTALPWLPREKFCFCSWYWMLTSFLISAFIIITLSYINHIHLSYYNKSSIDPLVTVFFSVIHSLTSNNSFHEASIILVSKPDTSQKN